MRISGASFRRTRKGRRDDFWQGSSGAGSRGRKRRRGEERRGGARASREGKVGATSRREKEKGRNRPRRKWRPQVFMGGGAGNRGRQQGGERRSSANTKGCSTNRYSQKTRIIADGQKRAKARNANLRSLRTTWQVRRRGPSRVAPLRKRATPFHHHPPPALKMQT